MPPKQAAKASAPAAPAAAAKGRGAGVGDAKGKDKLAAVANDRDEGPREPRGSGFVHVSGKPDKEAHEKEIKGYDDQIAKLRAKSDELRSRISGSGDKGSPANTRRDELRNELASLRTEQAGLKSSRGKILDQIKAFNDGIASKSTALKASREKSRFRSTADVDAEIKRLEKQVESGQLRLVDEKKALAEISNLKKSRKTVESFAGQDEAIQADKKQIEELRKQLDAPESKAASDRYTSLREELDKLNLENDAVRSSKNKLFEERDALKAQLDAVFEKKRDSRNTFKDASDKYYQKVQDEKRRRQEKERAERHAYYESKRAEENERLRENAKMPAYEREIEDCRNLINFFNKGTVADGSSTLAGAAAGSATGPASNLPQLNLRKVENDGPPLGVALKKKGEDEETFYAGKGGKRKGGKGAAASSAPAKQSFNMPLQFLSALISLGITTPTSQADVPQVVESLQAKRKWFEEHQDAETKKRIADVEKQITANEAKSREPTDAPSSDAKPPAAARRASAEAEIPQQPVEAPKVVSAGADEGVSISTVNAEATAPSTAELESAASPVDAIPADSSIEASA